jgi:monofunctional biosynthetic peptidoglycan transglycosylase
LPNPKQRSAVNPSKFVQKRALSIADGASTILKDERSDCFTD